LILIIHAKKSDRFSSNSEGFIFIQNALYFNPELSSKNINKSMQNILFANSKMISD